MSFRVTLLGDFAPVPGTEDVHFDVDYSQDDLVFMNLETPLIDGPTPEARAKAGPTLKGSGATFGRFVDKRFVVNLANNHMMDYGAEGLNETLRVCAESDCLAVGAGEYLEEALRPAILEVEGLTLGVLAYAETQFGIAAPWRAGVAPILPGSIESQIRGLADRVDVLVVSVDGAAEMSPWPSPKWQGMLRGFVDAGARVVYGHHSHVPQAYEEYGGGVIFYGLGNFLVNPDNWVDDPNTLWSLTPELVIDGSSVRGTIRTSVLDGTAGSVRVRDSQDTELAEHLAYMDSCNGPLANPLELHGLWQEASVRMYDAWYAEWLGFSPRSRTGGAGVRPWLGATRRFFAGGASGPDRPSRDRMLLWYHLFACESHVDAISTALGVLGGELDDLRTKETGALADQMLPWSRRNA